MCKMIQSLLVVVMCAVQMTARVFFTVILMLENILRMVLQTIYNFLSFMLQLLSLLPICVVFVLTTRFKCFMCGGGGGCPVNRGGACDCIMSVVAIIIVFLIFRSTGILDKIFFELGYAKAIGITKFVPSPGSITECSQNVSDYSEYIISKGGDEPEETEEPKNLEREGTGETEGIGETMNKTIERGKPEEIGKPDVKDDPEEKGKPEGFRADANKSQLLVKQKMLKFSNPKFPKEYQRTTIVYYFV